MYWTEFALAFIRKHASVPIVFLLCYGLIGLFASKIRAAFWVSERSDCGCYTRWIDQRCHLGCSPDNILVCFCLDNIYASLLNS
jgi:hypothetical protein